MLTRPDVRRPSAFPVSLQLKHHALVEASHQLEELQAQLQVSQAQLTEYHGLPASQVRCSSSSLLYPPTLDESC